MPPRLVEKPDLREGHHLSHHVAAVIDLLPLPDCNGHAFSLVAGRHHGLLVPAFALGSGTQADLLHLLAVDNGQIAIVATFETSNGAGDLPIVGERRAALGNQGRGNEEGQSQMFHAANLLQHAVPRKHHIWWKILGTPKGRKRDTLWSLMNEKPATGATCGGLLEWLHP